MPLALWAIYASAGDEVVTAVGTMMGAGVGLTLERSVVRREAGGPWPRRILGLAIGVAVVLALRFGLKAIFEGLEPEAAWRFARYAAMGLWAGVGAPWLMLRMGAARGDERTKAQGHQGVTTAG